MNKLLLSLFLLLWGSFAWGQTTVLDFETPATSTDFFYFGNGPIGGINNTYLNFLSSPANPSNTIAEFIKSSSGTTSAGAVALDSVFIDAIANNQVCIKVWVNSVTPNSNLVLKLEDPTDGSGTVWGQRLPITESSQWVTLCYNLNFPDFENNSPTGVGKIYTKLVLFFDFGSIPSSDVSYYFDDVTVDQVNFPYYNVRLAVDANTLSPLNPAGIYVTGSFQEIDTTAITNCGLWAEGCTPLSDIDNNGVWFVDLLLYEGEYLYKFLNGPNFDGTQEGSGLDPSCGVPDGFGGFNRKMAINSDTVIGPYFYNSCAISSEIIQAPIDYREVNISVYANQLDSLDQEGIFITGDFLLADTTAQTNCPNGSLDCLALTDADQDGIWETTLYLPDGDYRYRFVHRGEPERGDGTGINSPCAEDDGNGLYERVMRIAGDTSIGTLLYDACGILEEQPMHAVTFAVDMSRLAPTEINDIYVMGNMQQVDMTAATVCANWTAACVALTDPDGNGVYAATLSLIPGSYKYAFLNGDDLDDREGDQLAFACGVLGAGSIIDRVADIRSDTLLPIYHFNSCDLSENGLITQIQTPQSGTQLTVSPNPAQDHTQIHLRGNSFGPHNLSLLNATGQVIHRWQQAPQSSYRLSRGSYPAGCYWIVDQQSGQHVMVMMR